MNRSTRSRLLCIALGLFEPHRVAAAQSSPAATIFSLQSPRLEALRSALAAGNHDALTPFWASMRGQGPLIEAIPNVADETLVTFLWRGSDTTHSVSLYGGLPAARYYPWSKTMQRMPDTDVWYRTERMPTDARFEYAFTVNAPEVDYLSEADLLAFAQRYPRQRDPLNSRQYLGTSYVELPNAPPQLYLAPLPGVPRGTVRRDSLRSAILGEFRRVSIHLPAPWNVSQRSLPLLIHFDGEWTNTSNFSLPVVLDNLIALGKVPPMVTVLVDNQGTRDRDLTNNPRFAEFLAKELVPWLRDTFHVTRDPAKVIVAGGSNGGLAAGYAALRHSDTFGNVLAVGGWWAHDENNYARNYFATPNYRTERGWIMRAYASTPRLPIRFYLDVGRFDVYYADNLSMNRHMRDVLTAKGYPLVYEEYNSGHDAIAMRARVAEGLVALTSQWSR